MPEYLAPGVYVEEVSSGSKPIEGVGTSTAGFVGATERGPEEPKFISSWLAFQRHYGGYIPKTSYLAYAVEGFFQNGGQRCFVGRIASNGATLATGAIGDLNVYAVGRGAWGNRIQIKVAKATRAPEGEDWFRIFVLYYKETPDPFVDPTDKEQITNKDRREPDVLEDYDNLTTRLGASNNVVTKINTTSRLIRVAWADPDAPAPPDVQDFTPIGDNGTDGDPLTATDFRGTLGTLPGLPPDDADLLGQGRGLAALVTIDEVAILMAPDEVQTTPDLSQVTRDVIIQCETLKDRFAIVSAKQAAGAIETIGPPVDTKYAAFYYPWIKVYDPTINDMRLIPPTGHIGGIYARTDIERGVHKAPANSVMVNASNLQLPVTKADQDILNPKHVNCLRDFSADGRGIRVWGARTMSSDPEWKYVNVRRLFIFIEESIDEGTQWVVFEPNDESTWAAVRRNITSFLISVWRSGALMGQTQDEAFFVRCDRTTMTQDDIDNGRLICYIGIAPVKPAEFVIFRISQKTVEASA
jgi:uncharacterized protein